ncbi:MAG: UDP-N-acetylmuramoyl-tripeptide--D-alanyl-D-alanine ligase [Desertimonas sp.]
MRFRASEVAAATDGRLVGDDVALVGASFDSRSIQRGQLFVPVVAERDGHDFVAAAVDAGAGAYLTARPAERSVEAPAIEVADTADALMNLARWGRGRLSGPVVGITGSVGKTSTKDLVAAAVGAARRVTANERSFNNEQGLPVTVLGAPDDVEVLVVEMGMRGFGEIARLCDVARPSIGVVTAVAPSHTERVGGIEGVARAKAELIDALPAGGTAILNADDDRVAAMSRRTAAAIVTFGHAAEATVRVVAMTLDQRARPTFQFTSPWGDGAVRLDVPGAHMVGNAAAALAVAGVVGVPVDAAAAALGSARLSAGRMEVLATTSGGVVLNDAYNANPASMAAAMRALAGMAADRRIAVVGPMAELDDPAPAHRAVASLAGQLGIELLAVGTDAYGVAPLDQGVVAARIGSIGAGTVVLVKASNSARLFELATTLSAR